jgi:Luciferase-like monooxygenase
MNRLGMTVPVAGETMAELPAVLDELAGAGYSDIWTSEVNATDAFAPLLIAAQQAPRLRLGTSIAGVFSRSPALMAMSAFAVAELSDEPIYVGVGSSSQNIVEQWHGTPFVQPYQRVRDTVRFLRAAFAGQRVTFHGASFEVDGFRLARVPPRPPHRLAAIVDQYIRVMNRIIPWSQLSFVVQAHAMSGPPAVVIRGFQRKQDAAAFAAELAQRVRASGVEALRQEA